MSLKYVAILSVGTIAMFIIMTLQPRKEGLLWWKTVIIALLLTVTGTAGTYLMFFVENGFWGGQSFFGAIFIVPFIFVGVAKLFKIPYGVLLDLCAPAECIMLAIFKVNCYIAGCCEGKVIWYTDEGAPVFFPSQIVELICALLIMLVLIRMEKSSKSVGKIYPYYLLLYGSSRYILNWFRWDTAPFVWILPPGNFWSLCAILMAGVWLFGLYLKEKRDRKGTVLPNTD